MAPILARTLGIDISKERLDIHLLPQGMSQQFENSITGIDAMIRWLKPHAPTRIVFEATGAYHRRWERMLAKEGLPLVKVNPRQAKAFARAIGQTAKTDRIDAAMLARFGAMIEPQMRAVKSETADLPAELIATRRALTKDRTAVLNRRHNQTIPMLKRQSGDALALIDQQIKDINAECQNLIDKDPELARRFTILTSIDGIGAATAFAIMADMPELDSLTARQAASLAGLAPHDRQSGKWTGKASIQGGRAKLRQALYMPAIVAIRFNKPLSEK